MMQQQNRKVTFFLALRSWPPTSVPTIHSVPVKLHLLTCSLTISSWLSIIISNLSHLACSWPIWSTPPPATERNNLFLDSAFSNNGKTCKQSRNLRHDAYTMVYVLFWHKIDQSQLFLKEEILHVDKQVILGAIVAHSKHRPHKP